MSDILNLNFALSVANLLYSLTHSVGGGAKKGDIMHNGSRNWATMTELYKTSELYTVREARKRFQVSGAKCHMDVMLTHILYTISILNSLVIQVRYMVKRNMGVAILTVNFKSTTKESTDPVCGSAG